MPVSARIRVLKGKPIHALPICAVKNYLNTETTISSAEYGYTDICNKCKVHLLFYSPKNVHPSHLISFRAHDIHRPQAMAAMTEGQEQLSVLRRQAIIGNLYPSDTSVMESQ